MKPDLNQLLNNNEKKKSFRESFVNFFKEARVVITNLFRFIGKDIRYRWSTRKERALANDAFTADISIENLQQPSRFSHWILWGCALFFIVAIAWAKFAILDEVTRGDGVVIPSSQIQVIQNLEGGIVNKLLVSQGDVVKKGQILMLLDKTRFSSSFKEQEAKGVNLQIKIARLEAEVNKKRDFTVSDEIQKHHAVKLEQARLLHLTRMQENERMEKALELDRRELTMLKPLLKSGAASKVEIMQQERSVNEMEGNILKARTAVLDELSAARIDLAALTELNLANKDRLTRTTVRSPVRGIIKKINITTIGGVVGAGHDIMEIVPLDDTLLIEAKVKPQDIGFIHPEQDATVKISAYDYSIYGGLRGNVEQISADTIKDEKNEPFYIIKVRTDKNFLKKAGKELPIIPGMHATVDILTGHKSVLDYLLKPIMKARQKAMTER